MGAASMQLKSHVPGEVLAEADVCSQLVPLAGARVLELGCGTADLTRQIARAHPQASITALEVDPVQHSFNLARTDLPGVRFLFGGAQQIPVPDRSFDAVLMFKSLHHVPGELLDLALEEIHRVLVADGLAYFCEPVFAGEYNEILRIFHDEERARLDAFTALQRAVQQGRFELVTECFFERRVQFDGFAQFESKVIGATHTEHRLTTQQFALVRERFMRHATPAGTEFLQPMRADLLRKRG